MRISGWSSDVCSSDLGRKPKVSVADNLSCPAAGGSVPPSRAALTAQAFRDVEADGVDEAGLDLRRDRLPEIGKLAGKLALDLGPGQLAPAGPPAPGAVVYHVAGRPRSGDRRRPGPLRPRPPGTYLRPPRPAAGTEDARGH